MGVGVGGYGVMRGEDGRSGEALCAAHNVKPEGLVYPQS